MPELTADSFRPHLQTEFTLDDVPLGVPSLRLTEVRDLGTRPGQPRQDPFVLVFDGPLSPMLAQRIYALDHPVMGKLQIFLVPIGPDPAGSLRYEAVFN